MSDDTDVPDIPIEEGHRALDMIREAYEAAQAIGGELQCVQGTWYQIVLEAEAAQRRVLTENKAA